MNLLNHPCPIIRDLVVEILERAIIDNKTAGEDELDLLENQVRLHTRAAQAAFRQE